jgi:predicted transcriptional regulator
MKNLYLPVYRMAVSYSYSFGRRWSILEQLLLLESTHHNCTVTELAAGSNLPHRLVIEALINLLRSNWIEVRSDNSKVYFAATPAGRRRAKEKTLPERLQKDVRWDSVCVERLTGHWMRADDVDLVYEKDLPPDAFTLPALLHTFEPNDASLRDLFRLNLNESLEPTAPQFRTPSMPYARVGIAFNELQTGLPRNTPFALRQSLLNASSELLDDQTSSAQMKLAAAPGTARDDLDPQSIIVGCDSHLLLLREILGCAKSTIVIHSCFLSADTIKTLLPDLELAAKRRVRVDLIWGLHVDPEAPGPVKKLSDALAVLTELSTGAQPRIQLAPNSSGSHAKVILYDERDTGAWTTVVGSCNYLSSDFDWVEVSFRTRSTLFATRVISRLLANQLPAVGNWSSTARRLNAIWSQLKQQARAQPERGKYSLSLVVDHDHYACVTMARDQAKHDIEIVCDLYGLSAETSVLVPMETAAARGVQVHLQYTRPSKFLLAEGNEPSALALRKRGIEIKRAEKVHAKYLSWDENNLVISSFNWMATSTDSRHARGDEIGVSIEGPGIRGMLMSKLQRQE